MVEYEIIEELSKKYNKRKEYIKFLIKICKDNNWKLDNIEKYLELKW